MFGLSLASIRWIAGGLVAAVLLGIGYKIGHRRVAELEAEIARIQQAGNEAEAKRAQAQEAMDKVVKEKDAEVTRLVADARAKAEQHQKDLKAAVATTPERISTQQSQIKANEARQAKLLEQMKQASAAELKKLQGEKAQLEADRQKLLGLVDANKCLAMTVPDEIVTPFMK